MGKKARLKAKKLIEQIAGIDAQTKRLEEELAAMKASYGQTVADVLTEAYKGQTLQLGDVLNNAQIQAVIDILNRPNLDQIAQTKLLKQYLMQFEVQLRAIGVLPDYFAYVLIANADSLRQMAADSNGPDGGFEQPPTISRN